MKTLGCLDQILCLREAERAGCNDAIQVNTQGHLACATSTNVFMVKSGVVVTPDERCGILPGITRGRLIQAWEVEERAISMEELRGADEAFLTNSLIGVRPLIEIDGRPIGTGRPGPTADQAARLLE